MRLRGKLLRTVAQQRAGDDPHPIDPASLHFDSDAQYALRANFDLESPVLGTVKVTRAADGSLDAVATFYSDVDMRAIPYIVRFAVGARDGKVHDGVQLDAHVTQIALTPQNADRGMPLARMEA